MTSLIVRLYVLHIAGVTLHTVCTLTVHTFAKVCSKTLSEKTGGRTPGRYIRFPLDAASVKNSGYANWRRSELNRFTEKAFSLIIPVLGLLLFLYRAIISVLTIDYRLHLD